MVPFAYLESDRNEYVYLLNYPIPLSITHYAPSGMLPAAGALNFTVGAQILEHLAYHIKADFGTLLLKFRDMKWFSKSRDCSADCLSLLAKRECRVFIPALELGIEFLERKEEIIYVRPRVVCSFVPSCRTLPKCFIVPFFALLNDPLQADISPCGEAKPVKIEQ